MAIYAYESELANVMTMCRYYLVSWTAIICFSELKHYLRCLDYLDPFNTFMARLHFLLLVNVPIL